MIDVFRHNGVRYAVAMIDNTASVKEKIMEDGELSCRIASNKYIEFKRGDYVIIDGVKYHAYDIPKCSKNNKGEFVYDCELKTISRSMDDTLYLFLDRDTTDRIYQSTTEYDLTATVEEFLSLMVANMNRVSKGWSYDIDTKIDQRKMVNLSINGDDCKSVLKKICEEFGLEWEVNDQTIRVTTRVERKTSIEFKYPYNLISPFEVERGKNNGACTRLYVFGGNRNIPAGYNADKTNRLIMPNGQQYIETTDHSHVVEKIKVFDDIYPRRNSKIDGVSMSPNGFFFVTDRTIDFDLLGELTEKTAKIAFTDGLLVGYEFEIASYNASTKTIEIKQQQDTGVNIPNEFMTPRIGDSYVLLDVNLPSSYVNNAEIELKEKAEKYYEDECLDEISTEIKPSQIWLNNHNVTLSVGQVVRLKDDDMGIDTDIRIESVTRYPFNFRTQEIGLSNYKKKTRLERMQTMINQGIDDIRTSNRRVSNIGIYNGQSINTLNNDTQWLTMED